mmetsp:Transcript_51566/g.149751  ORF Transcript_51566/g.149751 Transcript_51566/m.149751 type:complete len:395 (-) Transcript_51566:125-1309(-)
MRAVGALRAARGRGLAVLQWRGAGAVVAESSAATEDPQRIYDELKYKVGYMGAVNHKEVGVLDLYKLLRVVRTPDHYKLGLQAVNMFYNFGVKLHHRELASRLVAAAMVCKVESEAVDLIKLYGTWLEKPPDRKLIYAVMGHFLDARQPLVVREIAKAVREDWRLPVEAPLYILAIEGMLQLPDNPLAEALLLHNDAGQMGVRLPAKVHTRLLDESLLAVESALAEAAGTADGGSTADVEGADAAAGSSEEPETAEPRQESVSDVPEEALGHLRTALQVAQALHKDGFVRGDTSAATLCSLSWLFWHLESLPESQLTTLLASADPAGVAAFLGGGWPRALEAAAQGFGCHWGFSAALPSGFFRTLEGSPAPEARRWAGIARERFGRFHPLAEGS